MRARFAVVALACVALLLAGRALAQAPDCTVQQCLYLPIIEHNIVPTDTPTATAIPTETPVAPTVTPTQAPATLHVKSSRGFRTSSSYYIVGEVYNGLPASRYFTQVIATFYDANGQLVGTEDSYTFLTMTMPGHVNPFRIILSNAPSSIARYELALTSNSSGGLQYRNIAVLSTLVRDNFGVEVFGEVQNNQEREVRNAEVAATFYDAGGEVVNVDFGFPSVTTLAPTATSPYKVSTFEDFTYASLIVQAQGYLAP